MHDWIITWFAWVRDWGYLGVFLLMAMESSVLPVPAEFVMPPAGYWVAKGEMDAALAIASGVLGSILGSLVNYGFAHWLGRGFVRRFGRYVFVSEQSLARAERYLERYELGGVFFARLLPFVRHVIGIPAGIVRMRIGPYGIATILGSALWCAVLAWFGQHVLGSEPQLMEDPDALVNALKAKSLPMVLAVVVLLVLYVIVVRMTAKKRETD